MFNLAWIKLINKNIKETILVWIWPQEINSANFRNNLGPTKKTWCLKYLIWHSYRWSSQYLDHNSGFGLGHFEFTGHPHWNLRVPHKSSLKKMASASHYCTLICSTPNYCSAVVAGEKQAFVFPICCTTQIVFPSVIRRVMMQWHLRTLQSVPRKNQKRYIDRTANRHGHLHKVIFRKGSPIQKRELHNYIVLQLLWTLAIRGEGQHYKNKTQQEKEYFLDAKFLRFLTAAWLILIPVFHFQLSYMTEGLFFSYLSKIYVNCWHFGFIWKTELTQKYYFLNVM